MGFFDFLKIFPSKKEEEIQKIKLDELSSWIDSWSKNTHKTTNFGLLIIRKKIADEKNKAEENIIKLEHAKLKNPNIPERAKQIMEGNRKIYIPKVKTLLEEINLPENLNELLEFCDSFNKNLDTFAKGTIRNYDILQEFFVVENSAIAANIRKLDELIKKVKKIIENAGIEKENELKNKVSELQHKIKQKDDTKEEVKLKKEELEKENKKVKEKENKIKELKEGSKYKKFTELVSKKKGLEQEIAEIETQVSSSFSVIKTALKKFERLTLEDKLVRKYLDNSLKTLLEDNKLKIVELVDKMKKSIAKGELKLREKKKNRILRELDKLTKNYLESFLNKHTELNKKADELKSEINKAEIVKEIEEKQEALKQDNKQIEEKNQKIELMIKELEKINIEALKKNLEEEIIAKTSQKVKIIS